MSELPPHLAEWIRRRIDELPADGDAAWLRRICKEQLKALPLSGNQVYLWALRPDGTVLCLDHEAFRLPAHEETDPATLHRVLSEAAVLYPELQPLVPAPPAAEPRPLAEQGRRELLDVLLEARALLARPENDFSWSGWDDAEMALADVDTVLRALQSPRPPSWAAISVLFLPTGPLQEAALRSGWGDDFVALARRCDAALAKACATAAP